jgi:hypothetical protein
MYETIAFRQPRHMNDGSMHGGYHRGQIARQLRAAGREPPYTDYIEFTRRDQ